MRRQGATAGADQGVLFDAGDARPPQAGSLNFDAELRAALNEAIAGTNKTREQIAAEVERLLGTDPDYPVSRALIDAWTAPSRVGHRFPLLYLPAFIEATGAHWLLDRIAKKCGRVVVSDADARQLKIAKAHAQIRGLQKMIQQLEREDG